MYIHILARFTARSFSGVYCNCIYVCTTLEILRDGESQSPKWSRVYYLFFLSLQSGEVGICSERYLPEILSAETRHLPVWVEDSREFDTHFFRGKASS